MSKIETERNKRGLTRGMLAKKVGVTIRAIEYYENLERTPRAEILKRMAKVLGCQMEDLIEETE